MSFKNIDEIEAALSARQATARDLYAIWELRQPVAEFSRQHHERESEAGLGQVAWNQESVAVARLFTATALRKEEYLLVCDAAREALLYWPDDRETTRADLARIRMDYAAALTRLGFTGEARRVLEPWATGDSHPALGRRLKAELLMQIGDILREQADRAAARAERLQKAEESMHFYERALQLDPTGIRPLVSAATAALYVADSSSQLLETARDRARLVLQMTAKLEDTDGVRTDLAESRAVAQAILGMEDEAFRSYQELGAMSSATTSILADARHHARFLAEGLGKPRDFFKRAFPALELLVFAGHMPDLPSEPRRFPAELLDAARAKVRQSLKELGARVALVSAAAGADLLFIDELRALGGDVHLVLPWSRDEFRKTSIEPFEPSEGARIWEPLFARALEEASTIREIGQIYSPSTDIGWQYTTEVTAGLALHTAKVSRLDLRPVALWDGAPGRGRGGTASFVEFWHHQLGRDVVALDMPDQRPPKRVIYEPQNPRSERPTLHQEVKTMLFADIVGYSKLTENVVPEFIEAFMGRVSQLAATSKHAPRTINTWGDAVYAVFDFSRDAGRFALELTKMIQEGEAEWIQKGLYWIECGGNGEPKKRPLNIRVGLHTGPVFMHYDPVVRQLGFTGAHVNRAARIEPVAKPGEVFASEEFAALAELGAEIERQEAGDATGSGGIGFVCEYAGTMSLAKGYPGRFRIYRVMPDLELVVDELAKAVHELYCEEAIKRGQTLATNSMLQPWEALPEDLKEANRAQVADIPNKLALLGYELTAGPGMRPEELGISPERLEELSIREHDRWMRDRRRNGWAYAPIRDNAKKHHPSLVPWEQLSESVRELDRDAVRNMPRLIQKARLRLRRR